MEPCCSRWSVAPARNSTNVAQAAVAVGSIISEGYVVFCTDFPISSQSPRRKFSS